MNLGYVLSLCDRTGKMVEPWANAGYTCYCVDIQHTTITHKVVGNGIIYFIPGDVLTYVLPAVRFAAAFAFTPCTDLAVSGARWFKDKGARRLVEALDLFVRCMELCEATGAPYFVENPVSVAATHLRRPDYSFHPCEYAGYLENPNDEAYTKKTCLWAGGRFIMPDRKPVEPILGSKMHLLPPSDDRADLRSETPTGFARAVFLANSRVLADAA